MKSLHPVGTLGLTALVLLAALSYSAATVAAADWPGFRGKSVDGVSAESSIFASTPLRLEVAWKKPLGGGYSGIAVADGRAVTVFSDGESEVVIALDAASGREIWRYRLDETYRGHDGSQDGPISTPAIADGLVFALGPRGRLAALDVDDGGLVWSTDLIEDHGGVKPHWGFGTSPLVISGVLIVQLGAKDAMVCGLDTRTGRRLWAAGADSVHYQSPVPYLHDGSGHVLAAGDAKLLCLDAETGAVRWEYAHKGSGEFGSICMIPMPLDDGRIFLDHQDHRSTVLGLTDTNGHGGVEPVWEARSFAKSYSVTVHHDGYIYGYNGRTCACVDANTGTTMWRSRRPGDGFPIIVDEHLVLLTKDGSVHIAELNHNRYQEIAGLGVFEDLSWSPPSFSDGAIYARSFGEIARIDVRSGTSPKRTEDVADVEGTQFAELLEQLAEAGDKSKTIDQFLSQSGPFPIIERDGRVIFVYRGEGQDLAIGGDLTGLGDKLPFKRVPDTNLFYAVARLEPDARICYAIVRDFKAVPDPLNPRKTMIAGFDEEMELNMGTGQTEVSWLAMPDWKPPSHLQEVDAAHRGRIASHKIQSAALAAEVAIDVYTPAGYEQSADRFPVAYVHDGNLARGRLQIPTTLDNLIGTRTAPFIAVFIKRQAPFFAADNYARMCAMELPAFVDEHYRTLRSREGRAHVAWGMAGYGAIYTAMKHADRIGKLGVQSPMMVDLKPIHPVMKHADERPLRIYLDWAKYGIRSRLEFWSMPETSRKLAQYFRDHGYQPVGGQANDGSGVPSWQNRTDDLFEALFPANADE